HPLRQALGACGASSCGTTDSRSRRGLRRYRLSLPLARARLGRLLGRRCARVGTSGMGLRRLTEELIGCDLPCGCASSSEGLRSLLRGALRVAAAWPSYACSAALMRI